MQLDGLTIALRARTPWEATDLGIALVRANASRIYAAWLATTLPTFAVLNLFGCWIGRPWLAMLALWWLKPAFDRIPLFVISRAVFGTAPSWRETFAAQRSWGWRGVAPWLLWRRLHPGRAMLLPVDLLEGVSGAQRRERVQVLGRTNASPNLMLTIIGAHLETMLAISIVLLGLMFVPMEFLSESARATWDTLFAAPPLWARVVMNFTVWVAMAIVEPFYVGAGFGLYLNRRMQLEAWDIELAFRRLAHRLVQPLAAAMLLACVLSAPVHAEDAADKCRAAQIRDALVGEGHAPGAGTCDKAAIETTLAKLFGEQHRDDGAAFDAAVKQAFADADLNPTSREWVWKPRARPEAATRSELPAWAHVLGQVFGFVLEYALWILAALLLLLVVVNRERWLPWLRDRFVAERAPDPIGVHAVAVAEQLPQDVPAAVRALLERGRLRDALALFYRAAVERLAGRLGTALPPGATESECLRQARKLGGDGYVALFARIVRSWQAAAYAQRMPASGEVEAMLAEWSGPAEPSP